MVIITGSKSENPKLLELVPENYQNLTKYHKKDDINAIQSWLCKQPHLPTLTDDQVMVFLHSSNYSVERTKEVLDNYYTLRTRAPEIFTKRNPAKILARAFKIAYFILLPESVKSYGGNQIIILKLRDRDPSNADFVEGVKTTFALIDLAAGKFPLSEGVEVIMDMEGLVLGHLTKIDFSALRIFMAYCQDAMPIRLKAVHVINTFSLINQIMALLKPFLQVEFLKKISFFSPNDFSTLTNRYIPLSSLPSDLGGSLDSLDKFQEDSFKQLELAGDWLEELEDYKVNESKRLGKRKSDLDACDGSFKKLELD